MEYAILYQTVLTILTSIITGGFVLVFVEIGNRRNRENDRYDMIMNPFMHKLSAYFRFIEWSRGRIRYPKERNQLEDYFKQIMDSLSKYGGRIIMSGGDYLTDAFTADELYRIAFEINNLWYWHDKMKPCNLRWESNDYNDKFIDQELNEINPAFLKLPNDVTLVPIVSSEFYVRIYQPIEYETYRHEAHLKQFSLHTRFVSFAVSFILFLLCCMLFIQMPSIVLQIATVIIVLVLLISLLLLGIDIKKQIIWKNRIIKSCDKNKKRIKRAIKRKFKWLSASFKSKIGR